MARKYPSKTTLLFTAVCGSFRKRNSPRPRLTSETSKLLLAKLSHGGLNSREISRYTINEKRNVPTVRLKPTRASLGSSGKYRESISGISNSRVAKKILILAISNSPATAACARTGSGRDQTDAKRWRAFNFIENEGTVACRFSTVRGFR